MADDLERAVLIQFDPLQKSAELKAQAVAYCEEIKGCPHWWQLLVERFNTTEYLEVKFWCLQTILEVVPKGYGTLDLAGKEALRRGIAGWMVDRRTAQQPEMLRNKLAQTVTAVVRLEYPKTWPTFFHDMIASLDQGPAVADMFCRILLAIDSDIISLDIHRTVQEQKVSVQLKDAMRDNCIDAIVDAWYKLVMMYCTSEPELTALVLHTLQKYISWMSVGLVVNNQFMPLLFDLLKLQDEALQEAAIDCLNEILLKGMEPSTKIHVVQKMGIVPCCAMWKDGLPGGEGDELRGKCAKLLATLCSEILECWKRVENSCIGMRACKIDIKSSVKNEANQICSNCEKMIDTLFPAVMAVISIREDETSMAVVPFLTAYVLRIKHFQERVKMLPEKELTAVRSVLSGILLACRYPSPSDIPAGVYASEAHKLAAVEEAEVVIAKRRDLLTIFKNIVRIHHEMVISTLLEQLQIILQDTHAPFQDIEILVTAIFELGEVQSVALQETGCGPLAALVLPLIRTEIPNRHHQVVSLSILELYLRCYKVPLHHQQHLPKVIATFIGEDGIRHPTEAVSDRACYLFMRFVKSCRGVMKPFAMSILNTLSDFFTVTLTRPKPKQSTEQPLTDHRLYVFEAAGLLLGIEDLDRDEQKNALITLLHPAIRHVESAMEHSADDWHLLQSLEMISRVSKGFKQDQVVINRRDLALRLPALCKSSLVYSRVVSFLHRMIELLGKVTLRFLNPAFEVLLQECNETARMIELVTLSHQLATAFKESLTEFLTAVLPVLFRHVWMCLDANWDWTGRTRTLPRELGKIANTEGVILDETREKEHLQRLYYGLIFAVFSSCDSQKLLELPAETLQTMLDTIQQGASLHVEVTIRRICFQIFTQLVERWSDRIESDASLKEYVIGKIGREVCMQSLFQSILDVTDAVTNALFQDIAICARTVVTVCGHAALHQMCSALGDAQFPSEFATELETQMRTGDLKKLKDFFKSVVKFATKKPQ